MEVMHMTPEALRCINSPHPMMPMTSPKYRRGMYICVTRAAAPIMNHPLASISLQKPGPGHCILLIQAKREPHANDLSVGRKNTGISDVFVNDYTKLCTKSPKIKK